MSKSAFARQVGVTPTCVWNWEQGNTHPRVEALAKIVSVLKTTKDFLERGKQNAGGEANTETSIAASKGDSSLENDVIRRAREMIANDKGLRIEQVKVILEYGD